jgi:putative addiction module CopG family antidote
MTIHLPDDLTRFIHDVVRSGRYASDDDVIRDALGRLQKALQEEDQTTLAGGDEARRAKPLTKQEFQRHLMEIGVIDEAPQAGPATGQAADQSGDNEEEVMSERMIRERLIEWLTGFIGD